MGMTPSKDFQFTPLWTAPEVLRSVGCVVIEMASARQPWAECGFKNAFAALYYIGQEGHVPAVPMGLSGECRDFIEMCVRRDPGKRCSARELMSHVFVKG